MVAELHARNSHKEHEYCQSQFTTIQHRTVKRTWITAVLARDLRDTAVFCYPRLTSLVVLRGTTAKTTEIPRSKTRRARQDRYPLAPPSHRAYTLLRTYLIRHRESQKTKGMSDRRLRSRLRSQPRINMETFVTYSNVTHPRCMWYVAVSRHSLPLPPRFFSATNFAMRKTTFTSIIRPKLSAREFRRQPDYQLISHRQQNTKVGARSFTLPPPGAPFVATARSVVITSPGVRTEGHRISSSCPIDFE